MPTHFFKILSPRPTFQHDEGTLCFGFLWHCIIDCDNKRPLQADFFHVLKQVFVSENKDSNPSPDFVCEALLRDTFLRMADTEPSLLQTLLQNMRTFIEEVYRREYNVQLILCKSSLGLLGKHVHMPASQLSGSNSPKSRGACQM